ncbi:PREDICTED: uncharacterized protein LOC108663296 [Theobroma cacao]|uniref:Uncharacterized protein LOC108663296 n=1 Tax=Theobroma cacao TaxID=3641 RepID=A0AB32WRL9_THECC|nr:PREDICTED: uncharacterized protein LOC108663296 [Theobroma cacao]
MTCKEMKMKKMTWKEMKMKMKKNLKTMIAKLLVMIVIIMKNMSLLILKVIDDGTMVKGKHSKSRPRTTNASRKQVKNETSTHDSHRSTSIDLGANVDDTSSRSRDRGLSVGLQTLVDPSDRLHITLIGERYVILHYNEIVIFVINFNI